QVCLQVEGVKLRAQVIAQQLCAQLILVRDVICDELIQLLKALFQMGSSLLQSLPGEIAPPVVILVAPYVCGKFRFIAKPFFEVLREEICEIWGLTSRPLTRCRLCRRILR